MPDPLTWPETLPESGEIRLRRFRDDDLDLVRSLSGNPYIPTIGTVPATWSDEAGRAFIRRQHDRLSEGAGFSMVVARRDDDLGVGTAGLWLSDEAAGRARVGYTVAPPWRGHGYATMALTALVALAWSRPALHRLEAQIEPWNVASRRVAERAGFTAEGLPRQAEFAGRPVDLMPYALSRGTPGVS